MEHLLMPTSVPMPILMSLPVPVPLTWTARARMAIAGAGSRNGHLLALVHSLLHIIELML